MDKMTIRGIYTAIKSRLFDLADSMVHYNGSCRSLSLLDPTAILYSGCKVSASLGAGSPRQYTLIGKWRSMSYLRSH